MGSTAGLNNLPGQEVTVMNVMQAGGTNTALPDSERTDTVAPDLPAQLSEQLQQHTVDRIGRAYLLRFNKEKLHHNFLILKTDNKYKRANKYVIVILIYSHVDKVMA